MDEKLQQAVAEMLGLTPEDMAKMLDGEDDGQGLDKPKKDIEAMTGGQAAILRFVALMDRCYDKDIHEVKQMVEGFTDQELAQIRADSEFVKKVVQGFYSLAGDLLVDRGYTHVQIRVPGARIGIFDRGPATQA
jgi:hypothetical protein